MKEYIFGRLFNFYYIAASSGIAYAGQLIGGNSPIITFIGTLLFFALLRIDNDIQDYARDKIAHPMRISLKKIQLQAIEKYVWRANMACAIFLILFHWISGFFFSLTLIYFWFARKDIRQPLVAYFSRQGMIIPLTLFASESIPYAMVLFGAFSTYEICRKLDPFAHPAIQSLLQFYGFNKIYWLVVAQLVIAAIGAWFLNAYLFLWPAEIGTLYILFRLRKSPRKYLQAQIAAAISLFIHIWFV